MIDFETEEFDEISYALSLYDLSQLKNKDQRSYQQAVAKLVPLVDEPTDEMIIGALYEKYENTASGKVLKKFDRLGDQGVFHVSEFGEIIMNF